MTKLLTIVAPILIFIGVIYGATVGMNIVSANTPIHPENPENKYPVIYGQSVVVHNNHYDIAYDGKTCFQWVTESMPVVILNPNTVTFTSYIDDMDVTHIIACEQ